MNKEKGMSESVRVLTDSLTNDRKTLIAFGAYVVESKVLTTQNLIWCSIVEPHMVFLPFLNRCSVGVKANKWASMPEAWD